MRLLVTICVLAAAAADEWSHKYKPNEDVTLWVNKVGPYHNPQETYVYYSLPFCSHTDTEQYQVEPGHREGAARPGIPHARHPA